MKNIFDKSKTQLSGTNLSQLDCSKNEVLSIYFVDESKHSKFYEMKVSMSKNSYNWKISRSLGKYDRHSERKVWRLHSLTSHFHVHWRQWGRFSQNVGHFEFGESGEEKSSHNLGPFVQKTNVIQWLRLCSRRGGKDTLWLFLSRTDWNWFLIRVFFFAEL